MKPEDLIRWLDALSLRERARELNKISHCLTVCAREFRVSTESQPTVIAKLLGLSELHHKISAQVGHYCAGEQTKVYPLGVFCRVLFETALEYGVESFLATAVQYTRSRYSSVNENPSASEP
jgi:hypothetical protein